MSDTSVAEAQEMLRKLLKESQKAKVDLRKVKAIKAHENYCKINPKWKLIFVALIGIISYGSLGHLVWNEDCVISMPLANAYKLFRAPADCNFCNGVKSGLRLSNINPDEFEKKYAYNGNVVIVTDATKNWTATEVFNFYYLKNLYEKDDPRKKTRNCQFFRYKTPFNDLFEAFNMEKDRVEYKKNTEPWYFGWSNCNEKIASTLRKHYERPYFLPRTSELNAIDWIFMGGSGLGAHMHVDSVGLPSWQAQLKGTKEWMLAPPPECIFQCHFFSVVVNPGDIIVLNTNQWFHKTNVLSDEISITIGAEYD